MAYTSACFKNYDLLTPHSTVNRFLEECSDVQTLHAIEEKRAASFHQRLHQQTLAARSAMASAQEILSTAGAISENSSLKLQLESQAQQIRSMRRKLTDLTASAAEQTRQCDLKLADLQKQTDELSSDKDVKTSGALKELQDALEAERTAKESLGKQLAAEKKGTQGLLTSFGDAQAEAQWKRKLSHLRAEHKETQLERDHYKRLCQSLRAQD